LYIGCPYAKGASGNVATEDVLYMLQGENNPALIHNIGVVVISLKFQTFKFIFFFAEIF
jgi:hydroxymethylglutaryl-CoA lyase